MKKELGIFVLLIILCAITSFKNERFLSAINLSNLANLIGMFGIFSLGMGLIIITGGIDLSVGSMFALSGVLLSIILQDWELHWIFAALLILALPMLLGAVHGALITRIRIQPFIVTLCGLLLYRGLARYIAEDTTRGFGSAEGFETLKFIAAGRIFPGEYGVGGIPMPFVLMVIIAVIMFFVLHVSVYGRYIMAVGRNEEAARFSGIPTKLVIASVYVVSGLLAGISGILFAFYTNSISPSTHGSFYELYGIAAAVLGGCSLRGGEGSIIGILIGTALLLVLQNLVNLLGIPSSLNFAVMGAVVLFGVLTDQIIQQLREKRLTRRGEA